MPRNARLKLLLQSLTQLQSRTRTTASPQSSSAAGAWAYACTVCSDLLHTHTPSHAHTSSPPACAGHNLMGRGHALHSIDITGTAQQEQPKQLNSLGRAQQTNTTPGMCVLGSNAAFGGHALAADRAGRDLYWSTHCTSFSASSSRHLSTHAAQQAEEYRPSSSTGGTSLQHQHSHRGGRGREGGVPSLAEAISHLRTLREAEELLVTQRNEFRPEHVVQLVACLPDLDLEAANASTRVGQLLKVTGDALCKTRSVLHGPEIASCIIAYARLRAVPPGCVVPLVQDLADNAGLKLKQCRGSELCSLAWALACLQALHGNAIQLVAFEHLSRSRQRLHLQQTLPEGNPSDTSALPPASQVPEKTSHLEGTYVLVEESLPAVWQILGQTAQGKLKQATGDDVAKLAWAMAKVNHGDLDLLDAIAQRVTTVCSDVLPLESQDPAASGVQLMSRMARLSFSQRRVALKALQQRKREIRVREAVALRRSKRSSGVLAAHEQDSKRALLLGDGEQARAPLMLQGTASAPAGRVAAGRGIPRADSFSVIPNPLSIANLLWAFLTLGQRSPAMLAALARAATVQKEDFSPSTLSTVLWAYAACGYYDHVMCNTLGRRAALSLKRMSMHEVAQVAWSLATLHHYEPLLTIRLAHVLSEKASLPPASSTRSSLGAADNPQGAAALSTRISRQSDMSVTPAQAVTLLWSLASMPPVAPAAAQVGNSSLTPQVSQAFALSSSMLCRLLSLPGAAEALNTRDCVRALWSIAVLCVLPEHEVGAASARASCRALAPALMHRLRDCSPQDLNAEQLCMLHAAATVVGLWCVPRGVQMGWEEDGANDGAAFSEASDGAAFLDDEFGGVTDEGEEGGWEREGMQDDASDDDDGFGSDWNELGSSDDDNPGPHTDRVHAALRENERGIIDISHLRPPPVSHADHAAAHDPAKMQRQRHEQRVAAWVARSLPEALRKAAREAVLREAAERVEMGKGGLWRHEVTRVAECLGLVRLPKAAISPSLALQNANSVDGSSSSSENIALECGREHAGGGFTAFTDAQGTLVALLCESQPHHTRSMPFLPLGATLLAHHSLSASGWAMVTVPWYEWATLQSFEDQLVYLAGKCVEADVQLP